MNYQHKDSNVIHIGPALPPISGKLIKWIEQGNFIEMAELLPESLRHIATDDDQPAVYDNQFQILSSGCNALEPTLPLHHKTT